MLYFVVRYVCSTSHACHGYKTSHFKKYTFNNMDDGSGRITENRSADICRLPTQNDYVLVADALSQISLLQYRIQKIYKGSMKNS